VRYPLVAPLAAFAAGTVAAQHATFSFQESVVSILLLAALAVAGLAWGAPRAGATACLAGFVVAGAWWASLSASPPSPPDRITRVVERLGIDLRTPLPLRGWVQTPPTARLDRDQFVLAVESVGDMAATGGVRVTAVRRPGEPRLELRYGERVELLARLRRLRNFENEGGFDRVTYLTRQGIYMTASVRPGAEVKRLEGRRGSRLRAAIWRAREWTGDRADRLLGEGSTNAGVAKAMVLGDQAYLDRALGTSFKRTGTYHALVVSGLHAALVGWFFFSLLRRLRLPEAWSALAAMLLLAAFVLLIGAQLPVVRAALMVGAYLIGRLLYRDRRALNVVAATALGMLLLDPADLFDVSFQLSFLSVALIAGVAAPFLERTLEPYRVARADLPNVDRDIHLPPAVAAARVAWRLWVEQLPFSPRAGMAILARAVGLGVWIAELFVVSAAVQAGLMLPLAAYFQRVSWSGLSANLLVIPATILIVPLGFAAIVTGWPLLGQALSMLVTAMIAVVEWHARLGWLEARVPAPPLWLGAAFAVALAALAWALHRGGRARWPAAGLFLAALVALVVHPLAPRVDPERLELTALDVGQGEALFLAIPQGRTMLIDGGGIASFGGAAAAGLDIGEDVVSPYLWSRSIRALDVVVISHAHYDHIGGLPALLDNFRVRELWIGNNPSTPDYERVLEAARRGGTRVLRLAAGDERALGPVRFRVLAPSRDYVPRAKPANDDSLVLEASYGQRRFLLAGDIERRGEWSLLGGDGEPSLRTDVLKVPHHGSKTSTGERFLSKTAPWLAVVSAGFDNAYGHPHRDVLDRLARRNARILRTDLDGRVTVATDGYRVTVSTYRQERAARKPALVE